MKRALVIIMVILIIASALAVLGFWTYNLVYDTFFRENTGCVQVFNDEEINLVIEDEIIKDSVPPKIIDEEILIPFDVVKKYFDPNIKWDADKKKVTITTRDKVIRMQTDNLDALVNNEPIELNIPVIEEKGTVFVPIDFLSEFYKINILYIKETNAIIIDYKNSIIQVAEILDPEAVIRNGRTIRDGIIATPSKEGQSNVTLRVFKEYENWYKVRTEDGMVGYIEKKFVAVTRMYSDAVPYQKEDRPPWKPPQGKISLVWDMIYNVRPDLSMIKIDKGLDVVSPTWFQLQNMNGSLINRCYKGYVDWAHRNNFKVWALLSNNFSDTAMTHSFLSNMDARDNLIREVLAYSSLYELDGINIDFENINLEDRDAYTNFVREIAPFLREQGLVVSIDVGVPGGSENYSRCFDHKELAKAVDYMMLMSYDQHWSTSPIAGSVAQITWTEQKLKKTLEMVPAEKLLVGLPLYIRLWKEEKDQNGTSVLSSKAITMDAAYQLIEDKNIELEWDKESGQFYGEYNDEGIRYRLWMENKDSIDLKSSLVHKYKLAGTSAWSRGFAADEIWAVLETNLKIVSNYQEWKDIRGNAVYVFNSN